MEDLTLDYLPKHDNIKIYQSKNMFRINTDTTLLGEFIVIRNNDRILDIGTNNGALLIYASLQGRKCELNGIDINKEALEIARNHTSENIREIRAVSSYLFKRSTKTITVEV